MLGSILNASDSFIIHTEIYGRCPFEGQRPCSRIIINNIFYILSKFSLNLNNTIFNINKNYKHKP
jgi:hypothetical protein